VSDDMAARVQVRAQILGCHACGLRSGCTRPVPFSGDNPVPIVVVGEAPGKEEDVAGRPFVGPAGRFLRRSLDIVMEVEGWNEGLGYVNAVSCYPARTPTTEEVAVCRENMTAQLRLLEPWYVLVLGGVAVGAFWPRLRVGEVRGRWWAEEGLGGPVEGSEGKRRRVWMFATFHPSAVLRAGGQTSQIGRQFVEDLEVWATVISSWKRPGLNVDCVKCKGMAEEWEKNMGVCRKHAPLAFGTVTSAKRRRSGGVQGQEKRSVTSRPKPGPSATPGMLFG
jgi:DNA polymerase